MNSPHYFPTQAALVAHLRARLPGLERATVAMRVSRAVKAGEIQVVEVETKILLSDCLGWRHIGTETRLEVPADWIEETLTALRPPSRVKIITK